MDAHSKSLTLPQMLDIRDTYRELFMPQFHANFVCEKEGTSPSIYSVLLNPKDNSLCGGQKSKEFLSSYMILMEYSFMENLLQISFLCFY